ncbi:hypothetical protein D9M73_145180 [compost metagenome]
MGVDQSAHDRVGRGVGPRLHGDGDGRGRRHAEGVADRVGHHRGATEAWAGLDLQAIGPRGCRAVRDEGRGRGVGRRHTDDGRLRERPADSTARDIDRDRLILVGRGDQIGGDRGRPLHRDVHRREGRAAARPDGGEGEAVGSLVTGGRRVDRDKAGGCNGRAEGHGRGGNGSAPLEPDRAWLQRVGDRHAGEACTAPLDHDRPVLRGRSDRHVGDVARDQSAEVDRGWLIVGDGLRNGDRGVVDDGRRRQRDLHAEGLADPARPVAG